MTLITRRRGAHPHIRKWEAKHARYLDALDRRDEYHIRYRAAGPRSTTCKKLEV